MSGDAEKAFDKTQFPLTTSKKMGIDRIFSQIIVKVIYLKHTTNIIFNSEKNGEKGDPSKIKNNTMLPTSISITQYSIGRLCHSN